jgi:hypothetical protein
MKKIILWSALFILSLWFFTYAGNISISPSEWNFWKWCIFGVDVNINTENAWLAAFDLVLESSMNFYDFVPTGMFPYYLPPKVDWNLVHIVGFSTNPNNRINSNWSAWKIYFKSNPGDSDWSIRIYFVWTWDTRDSNLSMPGWVDTLTSVKDWYFTFTSDGECLDAHNIVWWIISYQSWFWLDPAVVNKINSDFKSSKMFVFLERMWVIWISIIILLLILRYLHKKWYLIKHKTKVSHS